MARKIHRRRDADPRAGLEKYGDTTFADPVNKKYPVDTPGRIKAAWAYIHQPSNSEKYTSGRGPHDQGSCETSGEDPRRSPPNLASSWNRWPESGRSGGEDSSRLDSAGKVLHVE